MLEGLRFRHWRHDPRDDGILLLTLDRADSTTNSLSREVLDELGQIVERLAIEPPTGVIIRSGKDNGFIAGADVHEFKDYADAETALSAIQRGHAVFNRLAALRCPTVAAIHGFCMGGGLELALACRRRVASRSDQTRLGLPEVKLGIHPGWGGTVRLPALIGAPAALDLILSGRSLRAEAARSMGLVDAVADPAVLIERAAEEIRHPHARSLKQRALAFATNTWPARQVIARMTSQQLARKARKEHYPAPYAALELWRRHGGNPARMLGQEARSVARLGQTRTARNLVRVFFLQESLKQLGSKDHGITRVHVVGAGVMGGDIAAWAALQGFEVTLQDRELKYIEPALERARKLFEKRLKQPALIDAARGRLKADVDGAGIATADLIIEAIFENLEAKQALFKRLETDARPEAVLASNTSSIPLQDIASALKQPGRLIGLHFFNPVAMMPLVEVVRHPASSADSLERASGFARSLDKLPVPVASAPGFLVNRILMPYLLEAMTLYAEGVPGPVIDKAAVRWGMPMGPIELADTVGLDVAASVGKILAEFLSLPVPKGLEGLLESGKRGKKDGQGFYLWEDGKAKKPEVDEDYVAPEDLTDRLILPMLNESVACLAEKVVASPEHLDAGVIFGTGFAPFRGGPWQTIQDEGADHVRARLEALAKRHGPRFSPRPGWNAISSTH